MSDPITLLQVYVVIEWAYDGDSNLGGYYKAVFATPGEALAYIGSGRMITADEWQLHDDAKTPKDWGAYGSESRWEIRLELIHIPVTSHTSSNPKS